MIICSLPQSFPSMTKLTVCVKIQNVDVGDFFSAYVFVPGLSMLGFSLDLVLLKAELLTRFITCMYHHFVYLSLFNLNKNSLQSVLD